MANGPAKYIKLIIEIFILVSQHDQYKISNPNLLFDRTHIICCIFAIRPKFVNLILKNNWLLKSSLIEIFLDMTQDFLSNFVQIHAKLSLNFEQHSISRRHSGSLWNQECLESSMYFWRSIY